MLPTHQLTEIIMSAPENKKLMEEIFAGLANRDGTLFTERMADDFRWINIGTTKWSGTFDGKAAVLRDLLAPLRARLVERSRTSAHRFIAEGDHVVVEARGDNVTKAGMRYDNEYCFVFRLSGGMIREVKEYSDTALIAAVLGDPGEVPAAPGAQALGLTH
jgi:ketosteroid isomerase-like protein